MLMRTLYVDFSHVAPEHHAIDARLQNWARWSYGHGGSSASPMFRLYRAPQHWNRTTSSTTDVIDAQRIQKAIHHLPSQHRLALSWCYIRGSNPRKAALALGETLQGLAGLIRDGRSMLINRGV